MSRRRCFALGGRGREGDVGIRQLRPSSETGFGGVGANPQPQPDRDHVALACPRRIRRDVSHSRHSVGGAGGHAHLDLQVFDAGQDFFVAELRGAARLRQRFHAQRGPTWPLHRIVCDVVSAHLEIVDHMIRIHGPWRAAVGEQQLGRRDRKALRIDLQPPGARRGRTRRRVAQGQCVGSSACSARGCGGCAVARVRAEAIGVVRALHGNGQRHGEIRAAGIGSRGQGCRRSRTACPWLKP